jgi:hypothetical protein
MPLKTKHRGRNSLGKKFCRCIKAVTKTHKNKERAAIPICITSVLGKRGRTLKKFNCARGELSTQKPIQKK